MGYFVAVAVAVHFEHLSHFWNWQLLAYQFNHRFLNCQEDCVGLRYV